MDGMGSNELISSVPDFARGLDILLVDHETASLMYLAPLLEQYTFKVTTTEVAAVALSMIHEDEHRFRLVIANMKMPDMDRLSFLDVLLKKKIPIILMSSEKRLSVAQRALAEGAWYFLEKPVLLEDLKYIWQHAYRKRKDLRKEFQKENSEGEVNHISSKDLSPQGIEMKEAGCVTSPANGNASCDIGQQVTMDPKGKNWEIELEASMFEENYVREPQHEANFVEEDQVREPQCNCNDRMKISEDHQQGGTNILRSYSNIEDKQQERRAKFSSEQTNFFTIKTPEEQERQRKGSNYRSSKKARFLWTTELHLKFTAALSLLGDKQARPKTILKLMKVPNLTIRQVASHLQKYKAQVQRINEVGTINLPSVSKSYYDTTGMAQSLEKQSSFPSQLGYGSSYFRSGGNTTQFAPNILPNHGPYAGNFVNHDLRNPNQYFGYMGLSGNSNPYQFTHTNGVQTQNNPNSYLSTATNGFQTQTNLNSYMSIATNGIQTQTNPNSYLSTATNGVQTQTNSNSYLSTATKEVQTQTNPTSYLATATNRVQKQTNPTSYLSTATNGVQAQIYPNSYLSTATNGLQTQTNPNSYLSTATYGVQTQTNPNSYLSSAINGVQTQTNAEFQRLNQIREANNFPYDVSMNGNEKGKHPLEFEDGSVQVSNLDSQNLSYINLDAPSTYISEDRFQFSNVTPELSQMLDFTQELDALLSSPNQNQFSMDYTVTAKELECVPGQITSGDANIQGNFPADFTNESQQLEVGHVPQASSSVQNHSWQITSGDANIQGIFPTDFTNELEATVGHVPQASSLVQNHSWQITSGDNIQGYFPTDFNNGSQQLEVTVGHVPQASSSVQNHSQTEYSDLLKVLEEDPEEFNAFGSEPDLGEVDRYCEWLRNSMCGNTTGPEQLDERCKLMKFSSKGVRIHQMELNF